MDKIVAIDFSGTLIKPFVVEEANLKRFEILGIAKPSAEEHRKMHATKQHYDLIRHHIDMDYGITDKMKISLLQNYGEEVLLSGKDIKTMMMTDLFRNAMYFVANKHGKNIFADGMLEALDIIQKNDYKLAIVSGIRKDIITGMLAIAKCPLKFDYICAQDPVLSRDDNQQLETELSRHGKISFIIGDKLDDLLPAKKLGAKSVFVKWGHASGGEEEFADYSINEPKDLEKIIK